VAGYLTEGFGFSAFVQDAGAVYQTYPTTSRGIEFLKGYYGFSTRCRKAGTRARVADLDPMPR